MKRVCNVPLILMVSQTMSLMVPLAFGILVGMTVPAMGQFIDPPPQNSSTAESADLTGSAGSTGSTELTGSAGSTEFESSTLSPESVSQLTRVPVEGSATGEYLDGVALRSGKPLLSAARQTLKKWAKINSQAEAHLAATELLLIYEELRADTELVDALRLKQLSLVRSRLRSLQTTIKAYAAQDRKAAREVAGEAVKDRQALRKSDKPRSLTLPEDKTSFEAQFNAGGNENEGGLFGYTSDADEGDKLVELIQKTVMQPTWNVNGGEGSIYYYRQMKVLVVNQTQEGHEEISQLLEALRRAGN